MKHLDWTPDLKLHPKSKLDNYRFIVKDGNSIEETLRKAGMVKTDEPAYPGWHTWKIAESKSE